MRSLLHLAAASAALIFAGATSAATLTFNFSGKVSAILSDDNSGSFASTFAVGDTVTGQWTIDTTATDTVLIPGQVHAYDASFSATVSGQAFSGAAQHRIFNDHTSVDDGFSIINETGTYSAPALGPLVASTFFIQFVGMPTSTLADFSQVTDPISLIPLSTSVAPHGLRLDNPDGSFGALYFNIQSVTAVPEPATYAMLLTGLGVLGLIARRRRPSVV